MSTNHTYQYFDRYLDELRARGRYTVTGEEVREKFNLNAGAFKKAAQRLQEKNRITRLRQNFYLIIPPEFASRKTLPLSYFIDDLMNFLNRDYYVGLLTAAMYHGAAHQQPQQHFVVHKPAQLRPIEGQIQTIIFCLKKEWDDGDIEQKKTDAGFINVSNPGLTALDVIYYVDRIGGYNRAAEVMTELITGINRKQLYQASRHFYQTTVVQRLGYIMDTVCKQTELADAVFEALEQRSFYPTQLSPAAETENQKAPNRWKVIPNIEVKIEL